MSEHSADAWEAAVRRLLHTHDLMVGWESRQHDFKGRHTRWSDAMKLLREMCGVGPEPPVFPPKANTE